MPTTASAAGRPARGRARAALQASGMRLTADRGLENVSVADILADAGLSRRTFYSQFANKHELVGSAINPALRDGAALLEELLTRPPEHILPGIVDTYLTLWERHGDALIAIAGIDKGIMSHIVVAHRQFGTALRRALERAGEVHRLRTGDPELSFRVITRTAVPLLKIHGATRDGRALYRESMLALLESDARPEFDDE